MKNTHPPCGFAGALAVALALMLVSPPILAQDAQPTPAPAPAPASPPAPQAGYDTGRIPAYIVGGLAIVSLGVGTAFAALSLSDHQQFTKNPTTATANTGETHEVTADMCFGGGATLAVAAVVMFFTHETRPPESAPASPRVVWSPLVVPHGAGAGAALSF